MMTLTKTMQFAALAVILSTCLPGNPTVRPATIRAAIDSNVDPATAKALMVPIFTAAIERRLDVRVKIIGGDVANDFTPTKPLSLTDFSPNKLGLVFKDSAQRQGKGEEQQRLTAATVEFEKYFSDHSRPADSCLKLARTAQEFAADTSPLNVLVVGSPVCASPRVQLKLAPDRRLLIVHASTPGGASRDNDCTLVAQVKLLEGSFPQAFVTMSFESKTLAEMLADSVAPSFGSRVTVKGCDGHQRPPFASNSIGRQEVARPPAFPARQDTASGIMPEKPLRERASDPGLARQVEQNLRKLIVDAQLANVPLSWGPNLGENYSLVDFKRDMENKLPLKVADTVQGTKDFRAVVAMAAKLAPFERDAVLSTCRVAFHRTWTELNIPPDPKGQTAAGKQMELNIAQAITDRLARLVPPRPEGTLTDVLPAK